MGTSRGGGATAVVVSGWMGERLAPRQWVGVLVGVSAATLYQRKFSPKADLKAASVVQFAASLAVLAPLAVGIEGFAVRHSAPMWLSIVFLVIFASILAVNALHVLMRHGEATRVASMMYLPPVFAVGMEAAMFGLVPSGLAAAGILLTCAGVAMTVWTRRRPALQAD